MSVSYRPGKVRRPRFALLAGLIAALALAACMPDRPAPTPTPTVDPAIVSANPEPLPAPTDLPTMTPEPTAEPAATLSPTPVPPPPQQVGPDIFPTGVNPLTGLPVEDPSVLDRRPLLIKISNAPQVVRPQSGLSRADLIFEYYVEGGWTRFGAVFYSQSAHHVGSVRSGRLPDLHLSPALDAILVFSGASRGVTDTIRESDLYPWNTISPQFGYGEPHFVRFPREGLPWEHTLFTDTDLLWQLQVERGVRTTPRFRLPGMAFHALPPGGGTPASAAHLSYARTSVDWRYDPVTERYLRWADGIPHTDAVTGEQLAFDNVVVMGSTLELQELFPEKYFGEEEALYIELTAQGPATLLRNGQLFEGRWVRLGDEDMFQFEGAGGPLLFKPGTTFFQIVRTGFEQLIVTP